MEEIIKYLLDNKKTISVMESCTGGLMSSTITNIPNASLVFKFGAVTYSNEYKIKLGVNSDNIDKYSVYSKEIACEMSMVISDYTDSDYGIGITGKLKKNDPNNLVGEDDKVYYAIYDRNNNKCYTDEMIVTSDNRLSNKEQVINKIVEKIKQLIK